MIRSQELRNELLIWLLIILILSTSSGVGNVADETNLPTQIPGHNAILMGTDWYPEQWPESRWERELQMMEAAHLNVVRLTEFRQTMLARLFDYE